MKRHKPGEKFGRLTWIKKIKENNKFYVLCLCECGTIKKVAYSNLLSGSIRSCGCLQLEILIGRRKNNKERISKQMYNYYKRNAYNRSIPWNLSLKHFTKLIYSRCYYCNSIGRGVEVSHHDLKYGPKRIEKANGVDRVNNESGYTLENVVPCCKFCNLAKNSETLEDFVLWLEKVYNYFPNFKIKFEGSRKCVGVNQ